MSLTIDDYTQKQLDDPGVYRARALSWTLEPPRNPEESQASCIAILFAITQKWHGKDGWSQEYPPGWFQYGRVYVIGKDGTLNERAVENLVQCGLWNADFDALLQPPPFDVVVHVTIEAKEYKGQMQARIEWINPDAEEPRARGFAPVNPDLLAQVKQRFGSAARAIAGGQKPAGARPPVPSPSAAATTKPAPGAPTARPGAPGAAPAGPRPPASMVPPWSLTRPASMPQPQAQQTAEEEASADGPDDPTPGNGPPF